MVSALTALLLDIPEERSYVALFSIQLFTGIQKEGLTVATFVSVCRKLG